jgi:hypothetical protein
VPTICYTPRKFSPGSQEMIAQANKIIDEYQAQGFNLTLRQLYYQFVARGLIANRVTEYKRLGSVINDARLAGEVDWEAIEDRTREVRTNPHWDSPSDLINAAARQYLNNRWDTQPNYVEVWIEKDALVGVFERACTQLDVPLLSCRGYTSQSEMWRAGQRLIEKSDEGKEIVVLHFGDHDPSGIDMTRDITDRLELFGANLDMRRLALNYDQVQKYKPPENPAKETDSRYIGYISKYGDKSYELDALEPTVLARLVTREVQSLIDDDAWEEATERQEQGRKELVAVAGAWDKAVKHIQSRRKK